MQNHARRQRRRQPFRSRAATHCAPLLIGADGRRSLCRAAAGIAIDERSYPQIALTLCLRHSPPAPRHIDRISHPSGPFTLVPLPGNARASSGCSILPRPTSLRRSTTPPSLPKSSALRIRSSARSNVEPGRGLFPLHRRHRAAFRGQAHRAGRRSRPCHPADRRAGAQSRPARRRHHRRTCGRRPARRQRHRRPRRAGALRQDAPRPTSAAARSRSTCSTARC